MYSINFDRVSCLITITNEDGNTLLEFNPCNKWSNYSKVSEKHYIDLSNNEIIAFGGYMNRVITVVDGVPYKKANQYDFDKWMAKEFPESDNAIIYNKCMTDIA